MFYICGYFKKKSHGPISMHLSWPFLSDSSCGPPDFFCILIVRVSVNSGYTVLLLSNSRISHKTLNLKVILLFPHELLGNTTFLPFSSIMMKCLQLGWLHGIVLIVITAEPTVPFLLMDGWFGGLAAEGSLWMHRGVRTRKGTSQETPSKRAMCAPLFRLWFSPLFHHGSRAGGLAFQFYLN